MRYPATVDTDRILRHENQLRAWIEHRMSRALRRHLSADDVLQDVMLKMARRTDSLPAADAQLRQWLRAAALGTLYNHEDAIRAQKRSCHRRVRRSGSALMRLLGGAQSRARTPSSYLSRAEARAVVRNCVDGLADDQRRAVKLHHLDELTVDETARAIGRSRTATAGLIKRALEKLRRTFLQRVDHTP